jgi:hypothetical protein
MLTVFCELLETRPIWTSITTSDRLVCGAEQRGDIRDLPESSAAVFHALA